MALNNWIYDLELEKLQALVSSSVAPTVDQLRAQFPELSQAQLTHLEGMLAGDKELFQDEIFEAYSLEQELEDQDEEEALDYASQSETSPEAPAPVETSPEPDSAAEEIPEDDEWSFIENGWGEPLPEVNPKDFRAIPPGVLAPYKYVENIVAVSQVNAELEGVQSKQDPESDEDEPYSVLLYWDKYETGEDVVLYRVTASDREGTIDPGVGKTLEFTLGNAYRDAIPEDIGLRIYRVWVYSGKDPQDCIAQQPKLVGEKVVILPPRNFKIVETNGTVSGTWTPMKGHTAVRLFVRERGSILNMDDPQNERRDAVQGRDFTCSELARGKTYDFQIAPVVNYQGTDRSGSGSKIQTLTISANTQAVEITNVQGLKDDDGNFTKISLKWKAPASGEVKIYLTDEAPKPDIIGRHVESSYIEDDVVLSETPYVKSCEVASPGQEVESLLDWPTDWDRVYCTPVNFVGDKMTVGDFKVVSRVAEIDEYTLHERVSSQLITFNWPKGAKFIDIVDELGNINKQLDHGDYRRQGGVRLELPALASSLYLHPKSVYAGEETVAKPTEVTYPGRRVFQYGILRNKEMHSLSFWVWSCGLKEMRPTRFQVVFNAQRLPLSLSDGEIVAVYRQRGHDQLIDRSLVLKFDRLADSSIEAYSDGDGEHWVLDPELARPGYYRMFVFGEDKKADPSQIMIDPVDTRSLYQRFER